MNNPSELSNVTGMILAAGLGTRLQSVAGPLPKPLVRVGGRALLDYALDNFAAAGIGRVVVNLHYRGQMIREHLSKTSRPGLDILYSEEAPLQGSGGGIVQARALLGESTFVTVNADTIINIDLKAVVAAHRRNQAIATLVLRKDANMANFGIISIDENDRVAAFLDTSTGHCHSRLESFMYTGVQVLEPEIFSYMTEIAPFSITARTYPKLLNASQRVFGFRFNGPWLTVGTPAELESAEQELRSALLDRRAKPGLS